MSAILRRPAIYLASIGVLVAGAATGLSWFTSGAIALVAAIMGVTVASRWPSPTPAAPEEEAPEVRSSVSSDLAIFRLEGEYWTIGYHGTTFRLVDAKGLRCIHLLLGSPGVEIHALDHRAQGRIGSLRGAKRHG